MAVSANKLELLQIAEAVAREKSIDRGIVISAMEDAIAKAAKTVREMRWFEVIECRGHIEGDKIDHWQVSIKVGFTLED